MKKIVTFFVSLLFIIMPVSSVLAYTDVNANHWAYNAINKLSEMGALNGYSDGSFRPNQHITRAEFCKIIAQLLEDNKITQEDVAFQDVTRFHWANEYIKKVSKYLNANKNRFYPDSDLLREDVALAMVNIIGKQNEEYDDKTLQKFLDEKLISKEYKKYISLAVGYGIMNGNADGTFNPLGSVTRAEMCQIIYNVILKSQEKKTIEKTSGDKVVPYSGNIDIVFKNNIKNESTDISINTNTSYNTYSNPNIISDENGVVIVKPIVKNYSTSDIWLEVKLEGNTLQDGGNYTIGREEYIIATIGNASSDKNFIYYSISYGTNYQTIIVQKVDSSRADIIIPEELVGKNVKISIWGSSTKDNKGYMTSTQIFTFNYTENLNHRGENYSENYSENIENRKADFIVTYNGVTIDSDKTIEDVKHGQKIIIRSKPVYNIQSIQYRWDKDIEYTVINRATETIEIPESFTNGSTHKLTVRIVDKDGRVYKPRIYKFTMFEKKQASNEK